MRRFSSHLRDGFPDWTSHFEDYEGAVDRWEERFRYAERAHQAEERRCAATRVGTAHRLITVQLTSTAARIVNLANGVVALLNAVNAHSAPAVGRALVESCGVPAYMHQQLVPLLKKAKTERTQVMVYRLGLGTDPGAGWGRLKPYRVSAFVRALGKEARDLAVAEGEHETGARFQDDMVGLYSALTDMTHPNWAAMIFSAEMSEEQSPTWMLQPQITESHLNNIAIPCLLAMTFGGRAWDATLDASRAHRMEFVASPTFDEADVHRLDGEPGEEDA
jgi:hypothetical protein